MNIGNKIKALRKKRGITQEQLAESIGVSFQAVSKWETGIALPDITLAPILASYFGVSMDTLFDFSLAEIDKDARSIASKSVKYREENPEEGRKIIEDGLKKYPDNDTLLNNLLYLLNNPDETISIASALIEKTSEADIKYDALRFLAYAYKDKGDLKSAEAAINQIPEIYFTKLTEAAFVLEGKPKFEAAEKQKWISFENLLQMMEKLAECYEAEGNPEKAAAEREKALKLIPIMEHKAFDVYAEYFKEKLQ
ncbi:MAG: helix-turn-helix transcriptional regulator [Clostridia bacterium]|nr:helix-turn-helix transcriptional regulator [Clostridia bacterium]